MTKPVGCLAGIIGFGFLAVTALVFIGAIIPTNATPEGAVLLGLLFTGIAFFFANVLMGFDE